MTLRHVVLLLQLLQIKQAATDEHDSIHGNVSEDYAWVYSLYKQLTSAIFSTDNTKLQFADPAVQDILTRITGLDLHKVFRPIKQELKPPTYKLMTDEQLEQVAFKHT